MGLWSLEESVEPRRRVACLHSAGASEFQGVVSIHARIVELDDVVPDDSVQVDMTRPMPSSIAPPIIVGKFGTKECDVDDIMRALYELSPSLLGKVVPKYQAYIR